MTLPGRLQIELLESAVYKFKNKKGILADAFRVNEN
jgi:hypothetical protein